MTTEEFKKAVAGYVEYNLVSGKYNESKVEKVAARFDAPKSAVVHWARGSRSPHPSIQQSVLEYIRDENFKEVVVEYVGYDHASGVCNKEKLRELAGKFGIMPSTLRRWATGESTPHEGVKRAVIGYIRKQTTGL